MKTEIDSEGRIAVPANLLRLLGLEAGSAVEIRAAGGRLEIEPAPRVRLERRDGWLVAVIDEDVPPVTVEEVNRVIAELRGDVPCVEAD